MIGHKYNFEMKLVAGGEEGDQFGVQEDGSVGGIEYTKKLHEPKADWVGPWSGLTAAQKSNLESFKSDVGGPFLKFLYYDESSYHWVRMSRDSLRFRNQGGNRWQTAIRMRKQLA